MANRSGESRPPASQPTNIPPGELTHRLTAQRTSDGPVLSGDETEDSVEPGVDDLAPDEQDDAAPAPPQSRTTPGLTRSSTTDFQQVWRFVSSTRIITILSFTLALIVGIAAWVGMN